MVFNGVFNYLSDVYLPSLKRTSYEGFTVVTPATRTGSTEKINEQMIECNKIALILTVNIYMEQSQRITLDHVVW